MSGSKHNCNKEVQLAEMHKDIQYIKETLSKEIEHLRKSLEGNGKEGFFDRIRTLEKAYWKLLGVSITIIFLSNLLFLILK